MAEAAVAWWEEWQKREDRIASIGEEIQLLLKTTHDKDFLAGMSEAKGKAKLTKAKENRLRLLDEYRKLRFELAMSDFSSMTESERAAAAKMLREKQLERVRRLREQGHPNGKKLEVLVCLVDFDPKKEGCLYYRRYTLFRDPTFDLDEESPFGPRRFCTDDESAKNYSLSGAVNILSVNIDSSDVGFPIHVYGTVIVQDSMDERCVYHFCRDGDHCQLIKSEIAAWTNDGQSRKMTFTPMVNKGDEITWTIGATRMRVKVFWSAMNA